MSLTRHSCEDSRGRKGSKGSRSQSVQGLTDTITSQTSKIPPLPPCLWITDKECSNESSDLTGEDEVVAIERQRVRSRFRYYKQRSLNVPLGIFWDIENCQVPNGCSAIDVVASIRSKFLVGRREADFVVVCDVRKESPIRLQELNDAQVSLIHVCGTQKNAADEKLRQCMRRFGELHVAPASLLLISGDINFAADLSDFRHRKNMEVILVHKQNTSAALIACASSHFCYNELTATLPRNSKVKEEIEEEPSCEMQVSNLPLDQPPERVSRRLRRLADNCGGKVVKVNLSTAMMRFPSIDNASRALKRMNGEDVFGRKISIRYVHTGQATYSSDEGYSTGQPQPARSNHTTPISHAAQPAQQQPQLPQTAPPAPQIQPTQVQVPQPTMQLPQLPQPPVHLSQIPQPIMPLPQLPQAAALSAEWTLALQQLPAPTPPPLEFCPPPAPMPRKITGAHGAVNLDGSACSSNSCDRDSLPRAYSPWNSSSFSEQSEGDGDAAVELTVTNLPMFEARRLQKMLFELFTTYVPVNRVTVWQSSEGPVATVFLRSEWDARVAIAKVHKRRLDFAWSGRRLELTLGKPSPAQNLDVLRARIRAIFMDQKNVMLPLLQLRDAYASRHCCALTTSDLAKVKDTVIVHETCGRMVQLVDLSPVTEADMEEAPWKCHVHAGVSSGHEDGSRILQPVYIEIAVLAQNVKMLLDSHRGLLPLLTFVECYEAMFPPFVLDNQRGVCLELLLRSVNGVEIKDSPSRHLVWTEQQRSDTPLSGSFRSGSSRSNGSRRRTAPTLEPMLMLLERELTDLLRSTHKCSIPFNKLIPSFHRHFGRQCRVADYGFTKLPDLLAALNNTIVVLGSGSSRIVTISPTAQSRRWTSDLIKLIDAQPDRALSPHDIPKQYEIIHGCPFSPVNYGVCTIAELMQKITPQTLKIAPNGMISLPKRTPTPVEQERTSKFADDVIELLSHTPNLRMELSRFVPAYHAHFGRQLRVAHYGCMKLYELFELIPDTVCITVEPSGDKSVRLTPKAAVLPISQRIKTLVPLPLRALTWQYAAHFKALPQLDLLNASSLESFVLTAGFRIENGMIYCQGDSASKASCALTACAVLSADRRVARGSSEDYFVASFRELEGFEPDVSYLAKCGVVRISDGQVILTSIWRTVWRVALLLEERAAPMTAMEIYADYTKIYEPFFLYASLGIEGVSEFLRQHRAVFAEETLGRWSLCAGVAVRRVRRPTDDVDHSVYDTPPGQKGSRVFDSPKINLWNSPPASALPLPSALLAQDSKRRVRLAPLFDAN